MTDLVQSDQFAFVLQLLQTYLITRRENLLLSAWGKLKDFSPEYKRYCSYISFAKPESDRDEDLDVNQPTEVRRSHTRNNSSPIKLNKHDEEPDDAPKFREQAQQSMKKENMVEADGDEEFEDVIIKRLQHLEQAMSKSKSRAGSSINTSYVSGTDRSFANENPNRTRLRFSLNPKYIPMREKLHQMNPLLVESQIGPDNASDQHSLNDRQHYPNRKGERQQKQFKHIRRSANDQPEIVNNINKMLNKLGSIYNSSSALSESNIDLDNEAPNDKNNSFHFSQAHVRHKIYNQQLKNVKIRDYPTLQTLKQLRHKEKPILTPRLSQSYSCIIEKKPRFFSKKVKDSNNSAVLYQGYD